MSCKNQWIVIAALFQRQSQPFASQHNCVAMTKMGIKPMAFENSGVFVL